MVESGGRDSIPEEVKVMGKTLAACGAPCREVHWYMRSAVEQSAQEVLFTYMDVYNLFYKHSETIALDATNLITWAEERKSRGLYSTWDVDSLGRIDKFFFVLEGGVEAWKNGSSAGVFDTTHGTNMFDMKLGSVVTPDASGKSIVTCMSFTTRQNTDTFVWIFTNFVHIFGTELSGLYTDEDAAIAAAIEVVWGCDANHYLCIWHLWQNFYARVRSLGSDDSEVVQLLKKTFWRAARDTDTRTQSTWDQTWNEVMAKVSSLAPNATAVLENMERLQHKKEKWAGAWTWQTLSMGVNSGQRIEGIWSAIKCHLRSNATLTELAQFLESFSRGLQDKCAVAELRRQLSLVHRADCVVPCVAREEHTMSEHGFKMLLIQSRRAAVYTSMPLGFVTQSVGAAPAMAFSIKNDTLPGAPPEDGNGGDPESQAALTEAGLTGGFTTAAGNCIATLEWCSCQFPKMYGIPCSHIIHLYIILNLTQLRPGVVHPCWRRRAGLAAVMTSTSRSMAPPLPPPPLSVGPDGVPSRMLPSQRYAVMASEFKDVEEWAQHRDTDMVAVRGTISALLSHLQDPARPRQVDPSTLLRVANPPKKPVKSRPAKKRKQGQTGW